MPPQPTFTEEALQKRVQKKQQAAQIRQYKAQQRVFLMTSRFNTQTRIENQRFREKNWAQGCLYCTPIEISQSIPFKAKLLVLEMDNDANQIFAIGMCANRSFSQKYSVHETAPYNRYNYVGKTRIPRVDFSPLEEAVFKALDQLCFYGNDHMKRGNGLKSFPTKLLINCQKVLDILEFLENMFIRRFS
jgi:hypothetical protein